MKTLQLTTAEPFDERAQLLTILKNAPSDGYTMEEVRVLIKAIDKLEASPAGEVMFEDEEWKHVKARMNKVRWAQASAEIVAFVDKINGATAPKD